MSRKPMSMEAVMDEERREVLALLESQKQRSSSVASRGGSVAGRSASPYTGNPRSPIRSLLESVEDERSPSPKSGSPAPRVRSMLDVDSPPLPPVQPVRSMLDVDDTSPAMSPVKLVFSAGSSPTEAPGSTGPSQHPRSMSDAGLKPVDFGPRSGRGGSDPQDPTANYQFSDIITSRASPRLGPRRPQGGAGMNSAAAKRAMAEVMRNADLSNLKIPGDLGSRKGLRGRGSGSGPSRHGPTSNSPHNRLSPRSSSPQVGVSARQLSPAGRAFLEDHGIDMQNAYRRLSDANLIRSGGSLSVLPMRQLAENQNADGGRLTKDYVSPDGEALPEDSSDEDAYSSDDERHRGRKTARSFDAQSGDASSSNKHGRKPLSLLAAAEEERAQVASKTPYKYRSLLDEPEITVTNPSGERVKSSKPSVRPANSFENPSRSTSRTPWDSDDEAEYSDIKRAQNLSFSMTPIMSTPDTERTVRIIYRGDFAKVQKEVTEEEHRRLRKYLVATDLSEESTHALEWAVGTVLRDGDTLVAIYCVDEETGIPLPDEQEDPRSTQAAAGSGAGKLPAMVSLSNVASATASSVLSVGAQAAAVSSSQPSLIWRNNESNSGTVSPAALQRERSKAEEDRHRAVQDITDRITRLLRKTRLQVRVIVEVLHCKNPRHLLTEVIDLLSPTMVILGSRGRSALKGVILGSFSNYLVTKSSAPVMVARKRLRKQNDYRRLPAPHVNNLNNPTARSLANAKID